MRRRSNKRGRRGRLVELPTLLEPDSLMLDGVLDGVLDAMAAARLRAAIGTKAVATVVKRGFGFTRRQPEHAEVTAGRS